MKLLKKIVGIKTKDLYLAQLAKIGITLKNPDGTYNPEFFYFIPRRYVVVKKMNKKDTYKDVKRKKKYKQISEERIDSPGTVVIVDMNLIEFNTKRITYKDIEEIEIERTYIYNRRK